MATPSRYDVGGAEETLENGVLKNKHGFTNQADLDDAESILFRDAYEEFSKYLEKNRLILSLNTLFEIHRYVFEPLYDWAGKIRTVDISKGGVTFASVRFLGDSLAAFRKILDENMPTRHDDLDVVAIKLAVIHNEFNAIHPFREGNGRTIRLFIDLITISLRLPQINWNVPSYMEACRAGLACQHDSMRKIIRDSISGGTRPTPTAITVANCQ